MIEIIFPPGESALLLALSGGGHMNSRRNFLNLAAMGGAGALVGCSVGTSCSAEHERKSNAKAISPTEDLMQEHGILKRILLIYEEGVRLIEAKQDLSPALIQDSAKIIRNFIEDYHAKNEEKLIFSRFRRAQTLVDLVEILEQQHQAGRRLTDGILSLTGKSALKSPYDIDRLRESMRLFIHMYAPHEAREDTVLFPAFRRIVSSHEYASLGEEFEKRERQLFGQEGFERVVEQVAQIERQLGIYDPSKFTPQVQLS